MNGQHEIEYHGKWIELTECNNEGLFLASIRIASSGPKAISRQWLKIDTENAVFFDFESACEEALSQAKAYIDAAMSR